MLAVEQPYRYPRASQWVRSGLVLATSGGSGPDGALTNPRFFSGFVDNAAQTAVALRVCAKVARTRFYVPPAMVAAAILAADPVVTSDGGQLRFESFSACCGVYSRLDVHGESLDGTLGVGTTNVDVNPPMRAALAGVGGVDPLHLSVGADDMVVRTMDGTAVERRVPLPERWLRGFAEVQIAAAGMRPVAELSGPATRSFLRGLPRAWRGPAWAAPAGSTLRISARPGAVCMAGPERLRVVEPLTRFIRGLRVYCAAEGATAASAWEFTLNGARFVVILSPEVNRGFSGEGAVLADLADDRTELDADLIGALLAWQPRIDVDALAADTALSGERVLQGLGRLAAAGRVGYDLEEGGYFHRELPYDPALVERMHPRLRDAKVLVDAVTFTEDGAVVNSGGTGHRVTGKADGGFRCTCPWWGRHRGERGPCKHVLAVEMASRS